MPTVKLNIPYRSQWDPDAKDHFADCGPTSLCMMLNALGDPINPDQMYQYIGERGASEYTSFSDLMRAGQIARGHAHPNQLCASARPRRTQSKD